MKPLFSIDLTTNKKNDQINGQEFLVQTPSAALSRSFDVSTEKAEETIEKSKIPKPFRIIETICALGTILIGCGILRADVPMSQAYQNVPELFWIAGICGVVWLVLWFWGKLQAKAVLETDESEQTFTHLDGVEDAIYKELSVPDNAKNVDVLAFFYKEKGDKLKICEKGMQIAQYLNPEFKIFCDSENLYLANLEGKYAFPLSSVVKIHTVKKHIRISGWNKNAAFNKGFYKQFKLTADQYGCIHCKYYYIVEFLHKGTSYGLYVPCYELPIFEAYTKQKANM